MRRNLIIYSLFFLYSLGLSGQRHAIRVVLDSGVFYSGKYYGGSTNSIRMWSRHADSVAGLKADKIPPAYIDTLSVLLSNLKRQKHFQQKVGRARYAKVYSKGQKLHLAFIPGWAILFFDEQRNYQYVVRGTAYAGMFERFMLATWP